MRKSIKLTIIAAACFVALSSLIYSGIAIPNLQIMSQDKIVIEPHTENSYGTFSFHFTTKAKDILTTCEKDTSCILNSLNYVSKNENQDLVLETFSEITDSLLKAGLPCHGIGHPLGKFLYDYTGNLSQALLLDDRVCGGSIYHGIMQEFFSTKLLTDDGESAFNIASNICNELFDFPYSQMRRECAHGVGHGLVIANNFDGLTAMKKCGEFKDGFTHRACIEGASMEHVSAGSNKGNFDEHNVLFPCSELDEKNEGACYTSHAKYILTKVKKSAYDAFKECHKDQNENHVRYCYYGIGAMQGTIFKNELEKIVSACQQGNIKYQTYCIEGASIRLLDEIGIDRASDLCNITPKMFKNNCYESLGQWIHTIYFTEEEIEKNCSQLKEAEYNQICIEANPEEIGVL